MPEPTAATATLLKVGATLIERTVPSGLAWIKEWWKSKRILVVGQARAGKTTFIDYLQHGLFGDEKETEKTLEPTPSARFKFTVGKDKALELVVQRVLDLAGQRGPVDHADHAFAEKPHAILVFLDLRTPIKGEPDRASGAWLRDFCNRLEDKWRASGKRNTFLRSFIVVLNKMDKVDDAKVEECRKKFRAIMKNGLSLARGAMTKPISVMPCVLVTNPDDKKYVDNVITHLAKALAG